MLKENKAVTLSDENLTFNDYYPDLRTMKRRERLPVIKGKMVKLKDYFKGFLEETFKGETIEVDLNGKILEAKLYDTGIREVLEKTDNKKASMLYRSEDIFKNARYLYSTQDKSNNSDIIRWNYFYTPLKIGDDTMGVRIAVRDINSINESQLYNWNIKKEVLTPYEMADKSPVHSGTSKATSYINNIPQNVNEVKKFSAQKDTINAQIGEKAIWANKDFNELDEIKFTIAMRHNTLYLPKKGRILKVIIKFRI